MGLQTNVVFNVPALPDNDVWFANSQAWSNYWNEVSATAEIDPIVVTPYVEVPFDESTPYVNINIDGQDHVLVPKAILDSYRARMEAFMASYESLRQELYNAGLIDNP